MCWRWSGALAAVEGGAGQFVRGGCASPWRCVQAGLAVARPSGLEGPMALWGCVQVQRAVVEAEEASETERAKAIADLRPTLSATTRSTAVPIARGAAT